MEKMKKLKRTCVLLLAVVMVVGLTGCGEISYDDIKGDWTLKSMNGKDIETYAAEMGTTADQAAVNYTITEDDKITATNVLATQEYTYVRKADGIEVMQDDKIFMSMTYDKDAKTLTYQADLGNGAITFVLEKGKYDFAAASAPADDTAATDDTATDDTATDDTATDDTAVDEGTDEGYTDEDVVE